MSTAEGEEKRKKKGKRLVKHKDKNRERTGRGIHSVLLLYEKFLQFNWLRAVIFQLNLKYLRVKITVSMVTKITTQIKKQWRKDFQIFKFKRFKN